MSELPIKATLKAGGGYDAPWLTVDANDPDDLAFKAKGLIEHPTALQAVIDAANALKAINNAAPLAQPAAAPAEAPAAPNGWGSTPAAAQQTQQAPPVPTVRFHPEGKTCASCGQTLQFKDVFSKAKQKSFQFWSCPNNRAQNDGHTSEFAN